MSIPRGIDWPDAKPDARRALIQWRATLSADDRAARTDRIALHITNRLRDCADTLNSLVESGSAPSALMLAVYWPIRSEPDFRSHYEMWASSGIRLALPLTPSEPGPLTFLKWSPGDAMVRDSMGIQVPARQDPVVPDVMIIPCLGYGDDGLRVGYGGGYYDRTLVAFGGLTLGVAFAESYLPRIIREPHDCLLAEVITD